MEQQQQQHNTDASRGAAEDWKVKSVEHNWGGEGFTRQWNSQPKYHWIDTHAGAGQHAWWCDTKCFPWAAQGASLFSAGHNEGGASSQTAVSVFPFYCDCTKRRAGATMQTSAQSAAAISVSLFHSFLFTCGARDVIGGGGAGAVCVFVFFCLFVESSVPVWSCNPSTLVIVYMSLKWMKQNRKSILMVAFYINIHILIQYGTIWLPP